MLFITIYLANIQGNFLLVSTYLGSQRVNLLPITLVFSSSFAIIFNLVFKSIYLTFKPLNLFFIVVNIICICTDLLFKISYFTQSCLIVSNLYSKIIILELDCLHLLLQASYFGVIYINLLFKVVYLGYINIDLLFIVCDFIRGRTLRLSQLLPKPSYFVLLCLNLLFKIIWLC